jgi:5-methylthioadenosine/S-adenosylhomocysteine deaminase
LVKTDAWNMGMFVEDPAHLMVEAASPENVDTVIVNGAICKAGGHLTRLDRAELMEGATASIRRIIARGG